MMSARSPATGRPRNVDCTPPGYGSVLGAFAVDDLGGVLVVELDVALVLAREDVDGVLDLTGVLVALAGVAAVTLLAKVDLLTLERRRVRKLAGDPDEQRHRIP